MRNRTTFLLSSASLIAAIALACSYGNYDGTFDGGDGGDAGSEAGVVVLTRSIDPTKIERLLTPDNVFQVTIPPGAFDAATTITIRRLADRLIDNNLIVPTYLVSAGKDPTLPVEVKFTGHNPGGGNGNVTLVPALAGAEGAFTPTGLVGTPGGGGGGTSELWGLAPKLGTFSLVYVPFNPQTTGFFDVAADSCLTQCCASSGGGGNAGAVGTSCGCAGPPNIECFLRACKPDVAAAIERCVEIANTNPSRQPVSCINSAPVPQCQGGPPQCGYPTTCTASTGGSGSCCINAHAGQCISQGGPGGLACPGIAIRCDKSTPCPGGTKCCVFDTESYCAATCPTGRTWCSSNADCDGGSATDGGPSDAGPCFEARNCPHGTCGTPPTACTN